MTIVAIARNGYTADGVLTDYDFTFTLYDDDDLLVTVQSPTTGARATLTNGVDYNVSAGPWPSGGTVTFTVAPVSGALIAIRRNASLSQESSFRDQATLRGSDLELAIDKIAAGLAQVQDQMSRALMTTEVTPASPGERLFWGAGSPEGVVAALVGALYLRTDGGVGSTLYVKEAGGATHSGWSAK